MKTLEQIKEEVVEEYGYKTNSDFSALEQIIINPHHISYKGLSKILDQVAIRYASQFEGRIKELEDMLVRVRKSVDWGYSCWGNDQGFILSEEIDSLINKGK